MAQVVPRMIVGFGRANLDLIRRIHVRKINPCYTPICDVTVEEPEKSSLELCNVGIYLKQHYIPQEPILQVNPVGQLQSLLQYYNRKATEGKLFYAKSNNRLLGLAIGHQISKKEYEELLTIYDKIRDNSTKNYFGFLAALEKKVDLIKLHNVKRVFNIDVFVTGIEFRRRALSKHLIGEIVKVLMSENYEMVKLATTSEYAAKAAAHNLFKPVYQVEPQSIRGTEGERLVPAALCFPHKETKIMVRKLKEAVPCKPCEN